jgi:serralysin
MWGGGGSDRFVFETLADSGKVKSTADLIYDFTRGDLLDFSQIDARGDIGGNQAFAYVGSSLFTGSGQIRSWNDGTDTYVAVNATGDHMPEMLVVLSGVVPLTSVDFVL